jgi:hypothetical protein
MYSLYKKKEREVVSLDSYHVNDLICIIKIRSISSISFSILFIMLNLSVRTAYINTELA